MARELSRVLIGTAGAYHVASELAARGFHAAITYGSAPALDILVAVVVASHHQGDLEVQKQLEDA